MPKLHIYKNERETCYAFAQWISELVKETLSRQDRFTMALSGGDTPKLLYKILATDYSDKIDWRRVHIFWGDERFVRVSDQRSNAYTANKMLLDHVHVPVDQIHAININATPDEAARQYEELLHSYFTGPQPAFDLMVLGIGEQGNLLSLFAEEEEHFPKGRWVVPMYDKKEDLFKVSLTITAINAASVKVFLLTGKRKEDIVQKVLKGKYEPEKCPAQLVATGNKSVHWFLDEGAAGKLIRPLS